MNPIKLSDERVREILGDAVERSVDLTLPEIAALAQAVLDLRTANGILEALVDKEQKEHLLTAQKALDYATQTGRTIAELEAMVRRVEKAAAL